MDYIVGVDTYGQPYIAHWGQKKNHKYIARISDGNGYRYFYTQAEWNAYLRRDQRQRDREKKKAEREASKVKVSPKQYFGGGGQREAYKAAKKQSDADSRAARQAERNYKTKLNAYKKAKEAADKANESNEYFAKKRTKRKLDQAHTELRKAVDERQSARDKEKASLAITSAKETSYEQTSLPGKTHKLVRKGKTIVKKITTKVGDTAVDAINTPLITIRKR